MLLFTYNIVHQIAIILRGAIHSCFIRSRLTAMFLKFGRGSLIEPLFSSLNWTGQKMRCKTVFQILSRCVEHRDTINSDLLFEIDQLLNRREVRTSS